VLSNPRDSFEPGALGSTSLAVELVGLHFRVRGSVNLGSHLRLSDLLNFGSQALALTVSEAVVLDGTGGEAADAVSALDVRLERICLVLDHSGYVPPPPREEMGVAKTSQRLVALTDAHLVTATFFTHPSAEPNGYLLATEPVWMPLTDVHVRSLAAPGITFEAAFGILNRRSIAASSVL